MALMECVRGERPGVFNNRLFSAVLGVLLSSEGTAPEVVGLLMGRFLGGWVFVWVGRGGSCVVVGRAAPACAVLCCMHAFAGQWKGQAGIAPPPIRRPCFCC